MLNLENLKFRYEPFPIANAPGILSEDDYGALSESYPGVELFRRLPDFGGKYSLSEANNPNNYVEFIKSNPLWSRLHRYVKSDEFVSYLVERLKAANVELVLPRMKVRPRATHKKTSLIGRLRRQTELSSRFEFSMLPGDGGRVEPHTDQQDKIVTLVISMCRPGEWDLSWGGGTAIGVPRDRTRLYNQANRVFAFDEIEEIHTYPFCPNQGVLFVKTYNSFHHVAPLKGLPGATMRKTLTVVIERLR